MDVPTNEHVHVFQSERSVLITSQGYIAEWMRQKDIVWEIKKISNLVWACLKGTIQEKTTKEKSTLKKELQR